MRFTFSIFMFSAIALSAHALERPEIGSQPTVNCDLTPLAFQCLEEASVANQARVGGAAIDAANGASRYMNSQAYGSNRDNTLIQIVEDNSAAANDNDDREEVPSEPSRVAANPQSQETRPPEPAPVIAQDRASVEPLARPASGREITATLNGGTTPPTQSPNPQVVVPPQPAAPAEATSRTPAEDQAVPTEETEQPEAPTIVDQEELDDKFDNFDANSCQWVEDMPRKIHEAPGCGRGRTTKICVGYVVCDRKNGGGKFIRSSTCSEENCSDAKECTKDRHFWSRPAAENDQKYLHRDIRNLIEGRSSSPGASQQ